MLVEEKIFSSYIELPMGIEYKPKAFEVIASAMPNNKTNTGGRK